MSLTVMVGIITSGVIVLVALIAYWIDESVEPPTYHGKERVQDESAYLDPEREVKARS